MIGLGINSRGKCMTTLARRNLRCNFFNQTMYLMEIIIHTVSGKVDPILTKIKDKISKEELKTWGIKTNTKDEILFNHIPEQWSDRALLKPTSVKNLAI